MKAVRILRGILRNKCFSSGKLMKYVQVNSRDKSYMSMEVGLTEIPKPTIGECLIKVLSFGINRADILQRKGQYPPPKGVTEIIGLECSGFLIDDIGNISSKKVMALLSGGAYAE